MLRDEEIAFIVHFYLFCVVVSEGICVHRYML